MVRAQIQFHEHQYRHLRSLAHRHRLSIAEVVRRLVDTGMQRGLAGAEDTKTRWDAIMSISGIASSGLGDLAEKHDDYLDQDFDDADRVR